MSSPSQSKFEEFLSSYLYSCQYVDPNPYSSCQEVCAANSSPQPNLYSSNQSYKQQTTSATFNQQPTIFIPTNDPSISSQFLKTNSVVPMISPLCGAPYPTYPTKALQERTLYNCTKTAPQYRDLNLSPLQWKDPTLFMQQFLNPTLSNTEILNLLSKPPQQLPSTSGKVPKPPRTTNFRTSFSPSQLRSLETRFGISSKIDRKDRMVLSQEIGVSETAIRTWFQNTRSKQKRKDAVVKLAKQAAVTGTVPRD